jgi:outer membrane protein OmpA-like peptidoglycan-associated protein
MVQFAGYKVEKGKLSLDLKYNVAKGQLTAANNILIDQFELGEKVDNPNAVSLPLELAVALLKDGDGKIKIDVPITGSLEDPQFSMSALIVDALANAITKVVTAPFHAIASLIGSEEDLSSVHFAAGKADLDENQKTKLQGLSKALNDRPVLALEIKGAAFEEQDWPAMTDDALYDQLRKIRAAEINKQGGKKIRSEYVELSDEEYKRLLAQLFLEKFPSLAEKSLLGTPRLRDPKAGDFYVVAKKQLEGIIEPEEKRLKDLAAERAQTIAKYIVQQGGVPNERVYILDTAIDPERENNEILAKLSLKVK